jgi:signal peptidase II
MIIIIVLILVLDQLTKFLFQKFLSVNQSIPVIKGIFHFTLVHNRGAAFGILKNQLPLLIFTTLVSIWLIFSGLKEKSKEEPGFYKTALSLILAGALGNLIDRLAFGYVIDFLDFRVWPVFNLADSAITVGAILLGWTILRQPKG